MRTIKALCCGLVIFMTISRPTIAAPTKPNVIFILVDDMGYGDLTALNTSRKEGSPALLTPNLDRMAAEGMRFTDQYCAAPVCAPSRASLLMGLSQGHCAIRDNQFDKPLPADHTLGTVLKQAGYYTAAIGKWGVGGPEAPWPAHALHRGFDEFYGFMKHGAAHDHYAGDNGAIFDGLQPVRQGIDGAYDTDLFTARAKRLMSQHVQQHKDQPLFLYLAYTLPHFKMQLPRGPYPNGGGVKGGLQWPLDLKSGKVDSFYYPEFADKNWPDNEKRFASMIHRLDDCVGDVLQTVRDLGIENNTLVIFSSDNGPHNEGNDPSFFDSWGPFDGFKRDVLEGGGRVPTIAWWPGTVPAQKVCSEPSAQFDWMATLAELAGVPSPATSDGVSLVPSLLGKPSDQRHHPYLYFEYDGPMVGPLAKGVVKRKGYAKRGQEQAIRIGDFVGFRYDIKSPSDPLKLFNVAKDPHQDHNLATDPANHDVLLRMTNLLITARTPDPDAKRPYDAELLPAVESPPQTGSLTCRQFEGTWPWLPDFTAMKPTKTIQQPGFTLPPDSAPGLEFTGYIKFPIDGKYTVTLKSDTAAVLWLHDNLLINDDAPHDGSPKSNSINLHAGWHPIRLSYRHAPTKGAPLLDLSVKSPDGNDLPLSPESLAPTQ